MTKWSIDDRETHGDDCAMHHDHDVWLRLRANDRPERDERDDRPERDERDDRPECDERDRRRNDECAKRDAPAHRRDELREREHFEAEEGPRRILNALNDVDLVRRIHVQHGHASPRRLAQAIHQKVNFVRNWFKVAMTFLRKNRNILNSRYFRSNFSKPLVFLYKIKNTQLVWVGRHY